jgi:ribosomal-protein-alanine N-acetyltransferase
MLDLTPVTTTFPTLATDRLVLRQITEEDAPALFEVWSDPEVARYLPRAAMTDPVEALQRVQKLASLYPEGIIWAIVPRDSAAIAGTVLLFNFVKPHFRAELGYELGKAHWGKGFATEAASAVIDFAFNSVGLHSLEAHIDPANIGSRRVLEKLGFVQEGYFREGFYDARIDRFTDNAVFSLLVSTWNSRPS